MSGKPAARQGDMTQYGGPIVQGSAGVRIGAPTGVACSVCPGGMTSGNPVNPLLGAKVLPGETDLALPGPLPFILSRTYSSYRTRTPAPVGVFGPGWKAPSDIRLQLRDDALVLNDNGGRSIHFEPLLPGEAVYSRSESMWLVRGGKAAQPDGHTLARLWGALPPDIRLSPHLYLATNSAQGLWWILGWSERVPGAEDVLPAPLPPYRVLTGLADRFGRTLTYRREAAGDLAGEITGVTDGAGREFRLVLTTQAQRAEEARTSSLSSSDSSRPLSASPFPDTLPGTEYGPDRGIRLSAVWLMHDPAYPESLPGAPLARYTYTESVSPYWTQNSREGCGSLNSGLHSVTPFSFRIVARMLSMSSFWKIRKFWRSPVRHSGGHTFMLYSIWFLSFSPSSNQVTTPFTRRCTSSPCHTVR
ncbi:hypothetical protein BHF50_23490 [Escherichia coli]|nr:hypothetical protein BHF50_23490 [Escherichia coli]